MKRFLFLGSALTAIALACWLSLPRAAAQPAPRDAGANVAAPSSQQAADVQHYNQLVQDQEQRARRVEALLERQEQLMDKQEAAFARFQKILDTWEQQQKQYQKYLDKLPK